MPINLTPHALNIRRADGSFLTLSPSGTVARVNEVRQEIRMEDYPFGVADAWIDQDIPVRTSAYGPVTGLPDPSETNAYIVSAMVRLAAPDRLDLLSPGELIRDDAGKPIGCDGLTANQAPA